MNSEKIDNILDNSISEDRANLYLSPIKSLDANENNQIEKCKLEISCAKHQQKTIESILTEVSNEFYLSKDLLLQMSNKINIAITRTISFLIDKIKNVVSNYDDNSKTNNIKTNVENIKTKSNTTMEGQDSLHSYTNIKDEEFEIIYKPEIQEMEEYIMNKKRANESLNMGSNRLNAVEANREDNSRIKDEEFKEFLLKESLENVHTGFSRVLEKSLVEFAPKMSSSAYQRLLDKLQYQDNLTRSDYMRNSKTKSIEECNYNEDKMNQIDWISPISELGKNSIQFTLCKNSMIRSQKSQNHFLNVELLVIKKRIIEENVKVKEERKEEMGKEKEKVKVKVKAKEEKDEMVKEKEKEKANDEL